MRAWYYYDEEATFVIRLAKGDLLNSDAEAIVNTVNCVGMMGRGITTAVQKNVSRELQGLRGRVREEPGYARTKCSSSPQER